MSGKQQHLQQELLQGAELLLQLAGWATSCPHHRHKTWGWLFSHLRAHFGSLGQGWDFSSCFSVLRASLQNISSVWPRDVPSARRQTAFPRQGYSGGADVI